MSLNPSLLKKIQHSKYIAGQKRNVSDESTESDNETESQLYATAAHEGKRVKVIYVSPIDINANDSESDSGHANQHFVYDSVSESSELNNVDGQVTATIIATTTTPSSKSTKQQQNVPDKYHESDKENQNVATPTNPVAKITQRRQSSRINNLNQASTHASTIKKKKKTDKNTQKKKRKTKANDSPGAGSGSVCSDVVDRGVPDAIQQKHEQIEQQSTLAVASSSGKFQFPFVHLCFVFFFK